MIETDFGVYSPKALGNEQERKNRLSMLGDSHIAPLTVFVEELRTEIGPDYDVPYFDPLDGGIEAKALFVLEAPGAKATQSGFISRDNPDETAKNMLAFLIEAELKRSDTILWNVVPWYIGDDTRIRPANSRDIRDGLPYLEKLTKLLPHLKVIALVGKKASRASAMIRSITQLPVIETYHPSPRFVNIETGNREKIISSFREVSAHLQ
jgi:uracil-DNA glycosylase